VLELLLKKFAEWIILNPALLSGVAVHAVPPRDSRSGTLKYVAVASLQTLEIFSSALLSIKVQLPGMCRL
jgi:hypothetical protein